MNKLTKFLATELLRQDPSAVDLSNGAMTQLQLFDLIDVVELASAIRAYHQEERTMTDEETIDSSTEADAVSMTTAGFVQPGFRIGRFTLRDGYGGPFNVEIENDGEAGDFDAAALEKLIADFYAEHF